jgi:hypothetical protein
MTITSSGPHCTVELGDLWVEIDRAGMAKHLAIRWTGNQGTDGIGEHRVSDISKSPTAAAFYELMAREGPKVRILSPPPASQQRTVQCLRSPARPCAPDKVPKVEHRADRVPFTVN